MTKQPAPGQVIWCLGMYASASTWTFNAVRQIIEASDPAKFHAAFVGDGKSNIDWAGPGKVTAIKSHEISSQARVLEVARRASKILITMRDPRDAVVSLMQAHEHDFDRALALVAKSALLCSGFAKDSRAKILIYETGFFESAETVAALARHLGYNLETPAANSIHDALKRGEVEKYISGLPELPGILRDRTTGDFLDPRTQWHSHHAGRNGEIGKWRRVLSAQQADVIMGQVPYQALDRSVRLA